MAEQTLERRNGDVFIEVPREEYGMVEGTLANNTGVAIDFTKEEMIGRPVFLNGSQWEICQQGADEATCDGLVYDPREGLALEIAEVSESKFVILVRGPAVVNLDAIEVGSYVLDTIETALAAKVPPIIRFTDESVTEESNA